MGNHLLCSLYTKSPPAARTRNESASSPAFNIVHHMKNLLNSTDIATIFLDSELRIRRFTAPATQIYKLIQTDLRRPLSDIVNDLAYPNLEADALEMIRSLVFCERQVETKTGRWYNVRIMPYRTVENVIDGVVVTFINITESKLLEAQLRQIQSGAAADGKAGESAS